MKVLEQVPETAGSDVPHAPAVQKAKTFDTRPEYVELEAKGLVALPPVSGAFLSCHLASSQWHGGYPKMDGNFLNRAPKWGPGLRSPYEALRLSLRFLWEQYYLASGQGKEHLDKLDGARQ